jgi:hypothetical protein
MSIEMDNRLHALECRVAELERRIAAMGASRAKARKTGRDVDAVAPSSDGQNTHARRSR